MQLLDFFPFVLAKDILGSEEEAIKIYVPGVYAALATLTEREQEVIRQRYAECKTLKAVGALHGVGQERIRQIQAKAVRKLRHPTRAIMFKAAALADLQEQHAECNKLKKECERLGKALEILTPGAGIAMAATLDIPLDDLDLSVRAYNCLRRAGKNTLGDIKKMTEAELMGVRNLGRRSLEEVKAKLREYGVTE